MRPNLLVIAFLVVLVTTTSYSAEETEFDLVLAGGRVIDPETGLDAVRHVAIENARIAAVSETPLPGALLLDVSGLVVSPGFIDLHTHSPTPLGQHYQLLDGVTTALELEAGAYPVDQLAPDLQDRAVIHYGASVGYGSIRLEAKLGIRQPHLLAGSPEPVGIRGYWTLLRSLFGTPDEVFVEKATAREREHIVGMLHAGLDGGGLGIGVPLDYFSEAIDRQELRAIFEVAGERKVPVFIHVRRGINGDPSGLREALELASETGAPLHICHIQHNAMRNTALFLEEIRAARAKGVDVTTEVLPYNAGSALISSAVFSRDWQTIFDIDYADVEWAATGERFDEETWNAYRKEHPAGQVIHHYVDEAWTRAALNEPGVIVVSDLLPMISEQSKVAPHNGAFSRVLGRYVRELRLLELNEALSRMTLLPARRLEGAFPEFERKGRVQVGADADLTVFDADRILDRATYQDPYQGAEGIVHVIVAGELALRDGQRVPDVYPGRRLPLEMAPAASKPVLP
jgi:cytosine/adenosine deaminase-related metal-dependent hydrolase